MAPRAFARLDDGTEVDITDSVAALYDLVLSSMDWGSGFLTVEDALPVAHVCEVMGYEKCDEVERYVAQRRHHEDVVRGVESLPPVARQRLANMTPGGGYGYDVPAQERQKVRDLIAGLRREYGV